MAQTAVVNIKVDSTQATNSVENLNEQINESTKSFSSLRGELRKTVEELQQLEPGSARFQELSLRAGELRDQIQDTNAVVNQLAGNFSERLFKGITGVVQVGVAGFQAISAAQALFGVESEELQQTMVKLQALLNLSQALETFAGLDQKIVEIRAAFTSLTVGTNTQTVAQTGLNVATTTGTVATTALGTAMKALPIIGLVAAIGTLVYGIYEYVSSSKEAAEEEKKRKKEMEDLAEAAERERKQLADSTGTFLLLIERLKVTNFESAERRDLLREINAEYGLNLQNIQDETKFLEQLETVANNYIEFQRTKFALQKNQEQFNKILEEEAKLNEELAQAASRVAMEQARQAQMQDRVNPLLRDATDAVDELNVKKQGLQKQLLAITQSTATYNTQLNELNKTIKTQAEIDAEKARQDRLREEYLRKLADAQRNYNDILKEIKNIADAAYQAETQLFQQREQRGEETIDLVERERDARLASMKLVYEDTKKRIQTEITDRKKRDAALRDLDRNYSLYLEFENKQRLERERYILNEKRKLYEQNIIDIIDAERKSQSDRLNVSREIEVERQKIIVQTLDTELRTQQLGLENYKKLLIKRKDELIKQYQLEANFAKQNRDSEYKEFTENLLEQSKSNKDFIVTRKQDENGYWEFRSELTGEKAKELADLSLKFEQSLNEGKLVEAQEYFAKIQELQEYNNLNEQNLNNQSIAEYQKTTAEKEKIDAEYNANKVTTEAETNAQIRDQTIETYMQIADYIASTFQQLSDIISEFQKRAMEDQTQQLEDAVALDRERIESNYAAGLISKEQYDNEVEQLEQKKKAKELQLARKAFEQKKTLDIISATIDGARAVLSAFAQTPGELIIKSIAAGVAAAFSAVQIGIIASQKFRAAKGGIVPGEGSGQIDSVDAKLAPGEAVINEMSTRQFLPLLSAINEANGGRSFMPDLPPTNSGQRFAPVFTETPAQEQIVRAYVVESDITDAQRRINRIEKSTTF
jgi:hypothetical protein